MLFTTCRRPTKNAIQWRKFILRLKLKSYYLSLLKVESVVRCREERKQPEVHQNRINRVEGFITEKEA